MTTVLSVLGVLVVLFAVAAVALRDEAVLVEAPPDRADLALPDDGPVTAADLERLRFGMALRGYRMAQVDGVLDRLAGELLERDEQLAVLTSEVDRLRAQQHVEAPPVGPERAAPEQGGPDDPEPATAPVALAEPLPSPPPTGEPGVAAAVEPEPAGQTDGVLLTADATVLETESPVEHVPDPGGGAEPLPGVRTLPGASPPDPVPFPEPVHTDEPVRAPEKPDGRVRETSAVPTALAPRPAAPATARDVAVVAAARALHLARRLQSRLASARRPG